MLQINRKKIIRKIYTRKVYIKKKCVLCKTKEPHFNLQGLKAEYCGGCKGENMINVRNKKCEICKDKRPSFNFPGLKPEYCKGGDMIDVRSKAMYSLLNKHFFLY
jgi:hypothetical protein